MERAPTAEASIRRLLHRRELAVARHRSAMSRQLGLADSEMLAVSFLAQQGELTPSELAALLDLSSGGVSALVQRLEDAGHVIRHRHPSDGRSSLLRLSPAFAVSAGRAFEPLVNDIDALTSELSADELAGLRRCLERLADLSERRAEEARRRSQTSSGAEPDSVLVPSLWS